MKRAMFTILFAAITMISTVGAAEKKIVIDFENPTAVKLSDNQAKSQIVRSDDGNRLQIINDAAAAYPGVNLKPATGGKWDLGGYDVVEMDVYNPQDVPVRVLLALQSGGKSDGHNRNTESVTVPARSNGKLVVPYGMWHGASGNDIDWSNIVSMQIMLDKPRRSHTFQVDNIRAVNLGRMTVEEALADPFFEQLKTGYGRGVNLGNALDAPREGAWGVTLKEEYFDLFAQAGFDSVRIPCRWSAHAAKEKPYAIDPKFRDRVDWVINNCLKRRLIPILNIHHYGEVMDDPDGHRERFLALWRQLSTHYKDYPSALAFELLNEPSHNLGVVQWNRMLAEAIAVVRETNPKRKIVVGPADWNSLRKLDQLELPEDDRNLVVTFHYYDPFKFTHQGASWVGGNSNAWLGTRWTGTEEEKAEVRKALDKAIAWGVANRRPIYMGEFGAYSKADIESRVRWTRFVAEEALKRKISIAYWEFCASFGVYDPNKGKWNEPLREALLGSE